jgi:hypothetical protein
MGIAGKQPTHVRPRAAKQQILLYACNHCAPLSRSHVKNTQPCDLRFCQVVMKLVHVTMLTCDLRAWDYRDWLLLTMSDCINA